MTFLNKLMGKMKEIEPTEIPSQEKNRIKGKIIKVSPKGWGFIVSKEVKFTRIFFHWSGLNQDTLHFSELEKGMIVEFSLRDNPEKGLRAIRIKVLENEDGESSGD